MRDMAISRDVRIRGEKMEQNQDSTLQDVQGIRELLSSSGYAEKAIDYYLKKSNMGSLPDPDQIAEITGPCGDTMRAYLKMEGDRIKDVKMQVLGCPGAIAAAMAGIDLIKGKTLGEAKTIHDRDIFRMLEELPDQKLHCIQLAAKTLQKVMEDYEQTHKAGKGE